jgi:DNA invertase Pin-like site-specific DNA recombinase
MKQTIIYLRTSTEEQNPQNQLEACQQLTQKLNLQDYEVFEDKVSGWKELERKNFNEIKKAIEKTQVKYLICWDLDRLYRNRKKLIEFFEFCKIYNCKIYSVRQDWLESINRIQEPFNEIMHSLMLQIMGWLAEEESNKKSERVKLAIKKKDGETYSKFGNKWGRKAINSPRLKEKVKELKQQGLSFREILKHEEVYFYDKNKNKKKPSLATIHSYFKQ